MKYFYSSARFLLPVIFAGLLACPASAAGRPAAPAPGNYVNDAAGVMDPGTVRGLNAVLADLDAKARAQVAVLVVKSMGGTDIETYAVETYKKWGIGGKKTDRGVLLLVAVEERRARIEVGYGLEGILPDGLTGAIQDDYIIPHFKAGDYATGIAQGSLALASVIAKDSGVTLSAGGSRERRAPQPMSRGRKIMSLLMLGAFIIFAIRHPYLALLLLSSMTRGGGGGFGGGGFGGFGGGSSGGGGSSRSW